MPKGSKVLVMPPGPPSKVFALGAVLCYTGRRASQNSIMKRQVRDGLVTYHFESLAVPGLVHAIFTRLGGNSREPFDTLNVGNGVGDEEATVAGNYDVIFRYLGLSANQVASAHQVHGNRVALATADDGGRVFSATDGLVTNAPDLALLLRFADCQPILLYDPLKHALGLIHAGWRGVAQGITRRAVETMQAAFGSDPQALLAGLGPAIGSCCYTVGDNVATAMGYALPDWHKVMHREGEGWRLDLPGACAQQLIAAGVVHIEQADLCSSCHRHEFFSHRASNGKTGRFAVIAYLEQGPGTEGTKVITLAAREPEPQGGAQPESLNPPGLPTFQEVLEDRQ